MTILLFFVLGLIAGGLLCRRGPTGPCGPMGRPGERGPRGLDHPDAGWGPTGPQRLDVQTTHDLLVGLHNKIDSVRRYLNGPQIEPRRYLLDGPHKPDNNPS